MPEKIRGDVIVANSQLKVENLLDQRVPTKVREKCSTCYSVIYLLEAQRANPVTQTIRELKSSTSKEDSGFSPEVPLFDKKTDNRKNF